MNLLGSDYNEILSIVKSRKMGGKPEAKTLFGSLYRDGLWELSDGNVCELPPVCGSVEEGETVKFLLKLHDGLETETIILPMGGYNTLCVSSQVGCRWSCAFCETGKMGLRRNLTKGEILAQLMTAQIRFKRPIRNIVFMGMGEAFDNFDNVFGAIDIISHPWAMNISKKSICVSTVGNVEGINRLTERARSDKDSHYRKLHLAVSLNGADDETRNALMPVNRHWPLAELKEALMNTEQFGKKDLLYFEYILISGVTDGEENAARLISFVKDFPRIMINLIPFNPGRDSNFRKPEKEDIDRFHSRLLEAGISVYTRNSQGERIMAACGQLGNRNR